MSGSIARRVASCSLLAAGFVAAVAMQPFAAVQADDGVIVLQRTVQPRVATRPTMTPDPNPITVNTNISSQVNATIGGTLGSSEVGDAEFASVTSGSGINAMILPGGNLPAMTTTQANISNTVGNVNAGHSPGGGGAGAGLSNQINGAIGRGLAPLQMLGGGR